MARLSLGKLERHLYSAADRLRQEGLDAATYKDYIFGMLFLKRCSDVFEAERGRIVARKIEQGMEIRDAEATYGENPDYYDGFFVPERARWTYLQMKLNDATESYGSVLDKALGALSEANDPGADSMSLRRSCRHVLRLGDVIPRTASKPVLQPIEIEVYDRRGVERQQLTKRKPAHHGVSQRLAQF
jgi:type I restriction-modification system DNA methylase subunit